MALAICRAAVASLVLALALTPAWSAPAAPPVQRLHALFDAAWERDLRDDPLAATYYGDTRFNGRWPDISPAGRARVRAADAKVLVDLAAIPARRLPPDERLNHELFRREYRSRVEAARFHADDFALTAHDGVQTLDEVAESMPFDSVADHEAWLARIETAPAYIAQTIVLLREAVAQKRTQPKLLVERMLPLIAAQIVDRPEASPFYEHFAHFPEAIPDAERKRLRERATRAIADKLVPAYRDYERFMRDEYLPAARDGAGLWDTPDGAAHYAERIRFYTGSALSADEIHALGLTEVARIHVEMRQLIEGLGFKGTRAEFFERLRTDPQFYYTNPDELFRAYVVTAKLIEPELPKLFGKLYRTPFGVRAIPAAGASNATTAYYYPPASDGSRAGYYCVNLHRPELRPKFEIEVLTAHESVPGHHLQMALAQEIGALPAFRRNADYTAFVEGWALYAERLGYELGLYKDPYSRFGQLTYEMWRAVRLVVDTGLHHKRWTRDQAIAYFKDNAARTEGDIVNEIDRYIGTPGQALAYKIGQLKIVELRAMAEHELGPRFDVRAFHDALLGSGALPLDLLEVNMRRWAAAQSHRAVQRKP